MFTGIVEEIGVVEAVVDQQDAIRLTVRGPRVAAGTRLGDSIAVEGCCLTVAEVSTGSTTGGTGSTGFTADVMRESLDRTTLGSLRAGDRVNLERALTPDTRLGGHLVQGHVDGAGELVSRTPSEHWELVRIRFPAALSRYLASKGSIAVDGISLTVVDVDDETCTFGVSLIPETLARTTLGTKQAGSRVNLEVDVIAKYVERLVSTGGATP
ncbi:MAG TPA: riboflavin synthase [Nocardioidaceae bacterium]|nr:riboflavin synthase [Nocardioidaceae bacterium]